MTDAEFERALVALPPNRSQLLPALLLAQGTIGYVPDRAIERIAAHLRLTVNDVEGVATSYPDIRRQPAGRHIIRVCTGLSCWARHGDQVLATLESALGVRSGDTTADGQVTLEEASCCFICAAAPVVEVDGVCRGRVTGSEVAELSRRVVEAGDG